MAQTDTVLEDLVRHIAVANGDPCLSSAEIPDDHDGNWVVNTEWGSFCVRYFEVDDARKRKQGYIDLAERIQTFFDPTCWYEWSRT